SGVRGISGPVARKRACLAQRVCVDALARVVPGDTHSNGLRRASPAATITSELRALCAADGPAVSLPTRTDQGQTRIRSIRRWALVMFGGHGRRDGASYQQCISGLPAPRTTNNAAG